MVTFGNNPYDWADRKKRRKRSANVSTTDTGEINTAVVRSALKSF